MNDTGSAPTLLREAVLAHVKKVLDAHDGNRLRAAEALGISRRTVIQMVKEMSEVDIEMEAVSSESAKKLGWKDKTLAVEYKGGGLYHYDGVPKRLYVLIRDAVSIGKALDKLIKKHPDKYPFRKIR